MSSEEVLPANPPAMAADPSPGPGRLEALACVLCRSRKLKCDRTKPACTRCATGKSECVYPGPRRKPAFKQRNVKQLEERLAQVEVLLNGVASKTTATGASVPDAPSPGQISRVTEDKAQDKPSSDQGFHSSGIPPGPDAADDSFDWSFGTDTPDPGVNCTCPNGDKTSSSAPTPFSMPDMQYKPRTEDVGATRNELLGLGLFEALPPTEMIEDLHQAYFSKQHPLIPIVHPCRYMRAFYSVPHLRPPMALTYAIWTMAAKGHEKYASYHDVFHLRARHYLEQDELKGEGEHLLTVAHAQAWALIATDEARCMWFTRAALSTARCIKLLQMLGLHRLDDPNAAAEVRLTIAPPRDWTELEERRRVFWGALCIDSHSAISTGWPCLIDMNDVTTRLPSSEEAFYRCEEEETCRLEDVFTGSSYSSFAGAAIICHIFNQILKHINLMRPGDCPDDFEYGPYWNKHRELDNLISSAFMFLPDRFRLPKNVRDPVAVHTNLNLHASTICLHNSAYEVANEHSLSETFKHMIKTRLLTAAQEVVNIVKLTSHANAGYRSHLVALALYVASAVYITIAQDDGLDPGQRANLECLLAAMGAIGKQQMTTKAFLRHAIFDLQRGGLLGLIRVPQLDMSPDPGSPQIPCGGNIPLFARSRSSRHKEIQPPLPWRIPPHNPAGRRYAEGQVTEVTHGNADPRGRRDGEEPGNANKRRRVAVSPRPTSLWPGIDLSPWYQPGPLEGSLSPDTTARGSSLPSASGGGPGTRSAPDASRPRPPHRAGSPAGSPPSAANSTSAPASTTQPSSRVSSETMSAGAMMSGEGTSTGRMADGFGTLHAAAAAYRDDAVNLCTLQGLDAWDATGDPAEDAAGLYAQVTETMQGGRFVASLGNDGSMIPNELRADRQAWKSGQGTGRSRVVR